MPDLPPLTRRTALRLLMIGALTAVTGCRPTRPRAASTSATTTTPSSSHGTAATPSHSGAASTTGAAPTADSADEVVVKRVADAERALLAAYDAAAADHPELADRLAPLRADHAAHLQGLVPGVTISKPSVPPSNAPPSSAAPTATASPSASGLVLDDLEALERAAAASRVTDVLASSGSLARLLASIGGCEAAHAALLAVRT